MCVVVYNLVLYTESRRLLCVTFYSSFVAFVLAGSPVPSLPMRLCECTLHR